MREILEYEIEDLIPTVEAVLQRQGIPRNTKPEDKIVDLVSKAGQVFVETAEPTGLVMDVSVEEFAEIYAGNGLNEPETPVAEIYPKAEYLALFAITLGQSLSDSINELFEDNDFALASMLDAIGSEATELAGLATESDYLEQLNNVGPKERQVLRYSPGYCGWHISGQEALFEALEPEEIGIELTDSFLMQPIKSISGVMIVGPPEIHDFVISYKFCDNCKTRDCRQRIKRVFEKSG